MTDEKECEFIVPDLIIAVKESPALRGEIQKLRKKYSELTKLFDRILEDDVENE